jgi:hypothetical protein
MSKRSVTSNVVLVFIDVGVLLGIVIGYRSDNVDKFGLLAVGIVVLLSLNAMFFLFKTDPDLSPARLKQLNKWVMWPIAVLAGMVVLFDLLTKGK